MGGFPVRGTTKFIHYFKLPKNEKKLLYWLHRTYYPVSREKATGIIWRVQVLVEEDVTKLANFKLSYRNFEDMVRVVVSYLERVNSVVERLIMYDGSKGASLPKIWSTLEESNKGLINIIFKQLSDKGFGFVEVMWNQTLGEVTNTMKSNFKAFIEWAKQGIRAYQEQMRQVKQVLDANYKIDVRTNERRSSQNGISQSNMSVMYNEGDFEDPETMLQVLQHQVHAEEQRREQFLQTFERGGAPSGRAVKDFGVKSKHTSTNKGPCFLLCEDPNCKYDHGEAIMLEYIDKIQAYIQKRKQVAGRQPQFKAIQESIELPADIENGLTGDEAKVIVRNIYNKIGSSLTPAHLEFFVKGTNHDAEFDNGGRQE